MNIVLSGLDQSFTYLTTKTGLGTLHCLRELEIEIYRCNDPLFLDGNQWECFLTNSFPYLSKFDFIVHILMKRNLSLNSFRTSFWCEEKKWFVAITKYETFFGCDLLTVPHFNTQMGISRAIIETTLPSSFNLNLNVRDFYDEELLDKDIPRCFYRYENIETFHWKNIYKIKDDDISTFAMKLNCFCNLNSVKIVTLRSYWMVLIDNFQKILDLLNYMPNVFKIVFSELPHIESYSNVKCANLRITSIEVRST